MAVERTAADMVIRNAKVRTLDTRAPVAEAIAFRRGVVAAVGSDAEVTDLKDGRTEEVDGGRGVVLPAFTDSHTHLHGAAQALAYHVDFGSLAPRSIEDVLGAIRERVSSTRPASWVRGENLNEHQLREGRFPTRAELDAVTTDHPVVISSIGNHVAMANSPALALAGIDRNTPNPEGGHIDRDENGEPIGILRERARLRLDARRSDTVVPRESPKQRVEALAESVAILHHRGIVGIHEIIRQPEEIADYQTLRETGRLKLRVQLLIRGFEARIDLADLTRVGFRTGFGDDWLKLGGIKVSVDGVCIGRNAAVYDAYPGEPHNRGICRIEEGELRALVGDAHRAGFRIAVHAIGQRAVDMALDAFRAVPREPNPVPGPRHTIEHAYLPPRPGQLEAIRDLGLILSIQPGFIHSFGDGWINVFGSEALPDVMPLRRALDLGIRVQANSDFPCSPPDPLVGIQCAVARTTAHGTVLDPSQAITVDEAIRMFTTAPAFTGSEEATRGTLALGKHADAVLLDRDPYEVDPADLDEIRVRFTIVGGEVVVGP